MKTKFLKLTFIMSLLLCVSTIYAQDYSDPKYAIYGSTNEERTQNIKHYNFFNDAVKFNQEPRALSMLGMLLNDAPKCSENLYIRGAILYRKKITLAKEEEVKNAYTDSLMRLYDIRMENFKDHSERGAAYIIGEKSKDAVKYIKDPAALAEIINEAIQISKDKIDIAVLQMYFKGLSDGYANDEIETELLLKEYDTIMSAINKTTIEGKADAKKVIEQLFLRSGAANCENLIKLFKPQYEAAPDNKELIAKILGYFAKNSCENEFAVLLAEKYHAIEPSASSAYAIAGSYVTKKEYDKAFELYEQAIQLEEEDMNKSLYATRAAAVALLAENPRKGADFARKAIAANADNGSAYLLLGQAYAQSAGGCEGFAKQTLFWLVVDVLNKAKGLLSEEASQVEAINKSIATFSTYFPASEDLFDDGIKEGSSYTVNCGWVSGTTTVRARK